MYTLVSKGSFWLSETPDVMSKSWGSAYNRVCSYVVLKDNATNRQFAVFNTHLDNVSEEARIKGINVITEKSKAYAEYPTIVIGDFNSTEASETYAFATQNYLDVKHQVANDYLDCATYQGWEGTRSILLIDYIMISQTGFEVNSYEVITKTYNGVYPSDHFPIMTKLTFTN